MSTEPAPRTGFLTAVIGAAVHTVLLFGLLGLYLVRVPAAKRLFDEFGLSLPWVTLTVVRLSTWLCEYWWALTPVALIGCAVDFVAVWWTGATNRRAALLWVIVGAVLMCGLGGLTVYAIEMPLMKLREALAR